MPTRPFRPRRGPFIPSRLARAPVGGRAAAAALIAECLFAILWAVPCRAVDKRLAERWAATLATTSAQLKKEQYDEALPALKRLSAQMCDILGPGKAAAEVFGIVIVERAIAEAGLGNVDDALWYWQTAKALYPNIAESDLSAFGEAGAFLKTHRAPALEVLANPELLSGEILPPRPKKRFPPKFPNGARVFRVEGELVVEVIIGSDGVPRWPRVLQPLPAPTLSYVALEAVRQWRFEPATLNGKPIDVYYNLTVKYQL